MPSSEIKDISMWSRVQGFVKKNSPDKVVACLVLNFFNANILPHFRNMLKMRQKKTPLDSFLVRHGFTDFEVSLSVKIPRSVVTSDSTFIRKVLMGGGGNYTSK